MAKAIDDTKGAIADAARTERRLLKDEQRATRRFEKAKGRLANAEAKLTRAQERFAQRQAEYDEASSDLLAAQQLRAAGPETAPDAESHAEQSVDDSTTS